MPRTEALCNNTNSSSSPMKDETFGISVSGLTKRMLRQPTVAATTTSPAEPTPTATALKSLKINPCKKNKQQLWTSHLHPPHRISFPTRPAGHISPATATATRSPRSSHPATPKRGPQHVHTHHHLTRPRPTSTSAHAPPSNPTQSPSPSRS